MDPSSSSEYEFSSEDEWTQSDGESESRDGIEASSQAVIHHVTATLAVLNAYYEAMAQLRGYIDGVLATPCDQSRDPDMTVAVTPKSGLLLQLVVRYDRHKTRALLAQSSLNKFTGRNDTLAVLDFVGVTSFNGQLQSAGEDMDANQLGKMLTSVLRIEESVE